MREEQFQIGEYFHVFNRGVDKRIIFCDEYDYKRFFESMHEFNNTENIGSIFKQRRIRALKEKNKIEADVATKLRPHGRDLVAIIAYCFNPNHFHVLLEQNEEKGIERFMHRLGMGYTGYFNRKYSRSGSLFQGTYKAVKIISTYDLAYISAYINGNPEIHKISKANKWQWSSLRCYMGQNSNCAIKNKDVLMQFKDFAEYISFLNKVVKESSSRKDAVKELYLESL